MNKYPVNMEDIKPETQATYCRRGYASWPNIQVDGRRTHYLYKTWEQMKQRCYNPNTPKWHLYGGKGIRVCSRWFISFWAFVEDMGPRPEGHTLDHINSDENYTKSNCRWANSEIQATNITREYTGHISDYRKINSHHRNLPIEARVSINLKCYRKFFASNAEAQVWLRLLIEEKTK